MIERDLTNNDMVRAISLMLGAISTAQTPTEVVSHFARTYWRFKKMDAAVSVMTRDLPEGVYRVFRRIDVEALLAGKQTLVDPRLDPTIHTDHTGGVLGELIRGGVPRIVDDLRAEDDPVLGRWIGSFRSAMALPLYYEGEPKYWTFMFRRDAGAFSPEDLIEALITGNMMGGSTSKLLLLEKIRSLNDALNRQFAEVGRVQQSLLPSSLPQSDRLAFAAEYQACEQAGGDFYDVLPIDEHRTGVLIGDVSGHGPGAAVVMALFHGAVLGSRDHIAEPAKFLGQINALLRPSRLDGRFVTACYAVLDTRRREVEVSIFGHPPPLMRSKGAVRRVDGPGSPPIGLGLSHDAESFSADFLPGDTLLFCTDGVIEALDPAARLFTVSGLMETFALAPEGVGEVVRAVRSAVAIHAQGRPLADDLTLLGVEHRGDDGSTIAR